MIKLLIFDLDGTLVDSLRDITNAVNRLLIQEGTRPHSETEIAFHIGEGLRRLLSDLLPGYQQGHPEFQRIESDFMNYYEEECTKTVRWMPGICDFLQGWRGAKAIITNKNWQPTKRILDHLGIDQKEWCFIAGVDSWTHRKPHPGPLLEAMRRAGTGPRETLMIGDGRPDLRAALASGAWSAALGFGYTSPAELQKLKPDIYLNSYEVLKDEIGHLNEITSAVRLSP